MILIKYIIIAVILCLFESVLSDGEHEVKQQVKDGSVTNLSRDNPCIIEKDGHVYDLTNLSKEKFWHHTEFSHNGNDREFFLSLCEPIIGLSNGSSCNDSDGVCFMISNGTGKGILTDSQFISAGKINSDNNIPEVTVEGHLVYKYENGDTCISTRGRNVKYTTELYLQCPHSDIDITPGPILMSDPTCTFIFFWITYEACPRIAEQQINDSCIIKYSNSENRLNLHSIATDTFYKPQSSRHFEINICSVISNGSCSGNVSVCETTDSDNPIALAYGDGYKFQWKKNYLSMAYNNTKEGVEVELQLFCDRLAIIPKIYHMPSDANKYVFKIISVNICTPKLTTCIVEDKYFNVYDLRPLHKSKGNWNIRGRNYNSQNVLYQINMCAPLNHDPEDTQNKCPAGVIGACQTSIHSDGSKNLGYITSVPIVNKDKSLTVLYTGGDPCRDGAKTSSTRITLICSQVQHPPSLIGISNSCEHVLEWHTPAACPVNVVSGKDCIVTDPLYGNVYDLNSLRNHSEDYLIKWSQNNFRLNVCGPLVSNCGNQTSNSSVCQLGSSPKSGGMAPGELIFNDGIIIMKFRNGSPGCGNKTWSSEMLLLCGPASGPFYLHSDESSCTHQFIWYTEVSCPPTQVLESCSVKKGNLIYDLMPLSDPILNQEFIDPESGKKYFLNVCRSVIHGKLSRCPYNSGSCMVNDLNLPVVTENRGSVSSGPYLDDNDHLKLKYENGDSCNHTHNYSTIIEFQCSTDKYNSYPILEIEEQCLLVFKWSTAYACPQLLTPSIDDEKRENCTAINPQTKYIFDMNELRNNNTPYDIEISNGMRLLVSVCEKLVDERCSEDNSGICMIYPNKLSKSGGTFNKELKFHRWSTYLEYEGEHFCDNGYKRSTKISFICQGNDSIKGPVFIEDDEHSCTYFINWYTDFACERHIKCYAQSFDHMFDLSSLAKGHGNYEVDDPQNSNITYLLNVCRPLNPVTGINCHPGSSSCLVQDTQKPLSLGHAIINPIALPKDRVSLMYSHGADCPEVPGYLLSTKIMFNCNRSAGAGKPVFLKRTHDCQVQFVWQTVVVCPPEPIKESQCQIAFTAAKANVDLTPLMNRGPYKIPFSNKTFLLNICGQSVCDSSAVCVQDTKEDYGFSTQSKLHWSYGYLVLDFISGVKCQSSVSGHRSSKIIFECDMKAGYGTPIVSPVTADVLCTIVFHWKTNVTCLESFYTPAVIIQPTEASIPVNETTVAPDSIIVTSVPPEAQHHKEKPVKDESSRPWISVLIAALVIVSVLGIAFFLMSRSPYGRRMYIEVKRSMARKGDEVYILDDHDLNL